MISHITIHPKILYYGAPVVLLSTENADGSTNISPISSSWALGSFVILGLGVGSQGLENLKDRPACVINLPDAEMWRQVEALASLTGKIRYLRTKRRLAFAMKRISSPLDPSPEQHLSRCVPSGLRNVPFNWRQRFATFGFQSTQRALPS